MIRRTGLALLVLLLSTAATAENPRLTLDARVTWRSGDPDFGGYSGLAVLDGGTRLVTVADRGNWATARLERDGDGRLAGIVPTGSGRLHAISGRPLEGNTIDAEGLAIDAEGRFYVSFEAFHRLRRFDDLDGPATSVPEHPDFPGLQNNSGLEALAIDAEGTIYAIPERSGAMKRPFPVYRLRDGRWDRDLSIRRDGEFLVVGADFGPDGRLYVLERNFRWLGGFATRIRRFRLGPDGFDEEMTLLESGFGEYDNLEGISVWRDGADRMRVTLVSDDNQFALQKTEVVEFLLTDPS